MQNYLLYGFPFVVALILWSAFLPPMDGSMIMRGLRELLSYNIMLWFTALAIFMVLIVVMPSVRDKTLRRLANLQERDEREEYITGQAARASYMATLSLSLLLLFISLTSFKLSNLPQTTPDQPKHSAQISFNFAVFGTPIPNKTEEERANIIFDSQDYSLSPSSIIILLLACQMITFNLTARKIS